MTQNLSLWELAKLDASAYARLLEREESDLAEYIAKVQPIIDAVRERGDAAIAEFTERFDGAKIAPGALRVSQEEFDAAEKLISPKVRNAIHFAAGNILKYHQMQMPKPMAMMEVNPGVLAGERWNAISSVACYVPRGKGSFPSMCLMSLLPAVVAGVPHVVLITPPGPDGTIDAATLIVAQLAGVSEVYNCGGAQAVAAVAYGTETIRKCDKIVGPGSPWVGAAVHSLSRQIAPGPPAGPTESIVLADASANPWKVALDVANESEHGPDSSVFLVTDDAALAGEVDRLMPAVWDKLSQTRAEYSRAVLGGKRGGVVLAKSMDQALTFCNDYAPEHLQVHSTRPFDYLDRITHAAEILLGEHAALCLGNFVLGPNAILPTGGAARTASPLSVYDYLKRTSVTHVTEAAFTPHAEAAHALAEYEGFEAHALSVSPLRNEKP
ncbi:MAG: histidinol dehydrogenase [Alphaproteobacteria bacterium]